jgi:hypothetical protein
MSNAERVLRRLFAAWLGCSLFLLALPLESGAQVSLTWNAFRNAPGSANALDFDCTNTQGSYRLVATFTPQEDLPNFGAMEVRVHLGSMIPYPSPYIVPPLQQFWHFETGGCNEGNIVLADEMPPDGGEILNPWGIDGSASTVYQSYAVVGETQGGGELRATLIRMSPFPLKAGKEYFAFTIDVTMCGATSCPGCSDGDMAFWFSEGVLLTPNGALLGFVTINHGSGLEGQACLNTHGWCGVIGAQAAQSLGTGSDRGRAAVAAGSGDVSAFVRSVTHGGTEFITVPPRTRESPCDVVPTRQHSWGTLKLRYR